MISHSIQRSMGWNKSWHLEGIQWVLVNFWSSKFLAARFEHFVCQFSQYGSSGMWSYNFLCQLAVVIPRLPGLFRIAKASSSTVELVNSETLDSVTSFNFAMWAFARNCFPIQLVPCSDGWQRTWWQLIHMIPGIPVSSIPLCKLNRHGDACLEILPAIGCFEATWIEAHPASKIICKLRLLNSWIKIRSFLEVIITTSCELYNDCQSNRAVGIRNLGNLNRESAESNVIVMRNAGS